jgi:hypothetical protein
MTRTRIQRRQAEPPSAPERVTRTYQGQLIARAGAGPGERIIEARVLPYGEIATVRDASNAPAYRETIARGAAVRGGTDFAGVVVDSMIGIPPTTYNTHAGRRPVGRGIAGEDRDDGAYLVMRIANTAAGDEAYELAREGLATEVSIDGDATGERRLADGTIERQAVRISRVAILESGTAAYRGATITAVRAGNMEGQTVHCQHCGAALIAGVGHSCEGTRTAAAVARAGTPAPTPPATPPATTGTPASGDGAEDDEADTPPSSGRTRVHATIEIERARAEGLQRENDELRSAMERAAIGRVGRSPAYVTRPEPIYGPGTDHSFFRDGFILSQGPGMYRREFRDAEDRLNRHYAMLDDIDMAIQRRVAVDLQQGNDGHIERAGDVLSSEIPGAYPNDYLPGLIVNRVLKQRPMAGFYQRFPITDGRPRIYPVVSTSTTAAAQGAEGSNPAASDLATTATTITPVFLGAETKVSRQVLDGADPSTDVMLQTDLTEAYMQASEALVRAAVEAGSTASGVTLTAATPQAGLVDLILNYLGNVFLPAEGLFLPTLTLYGSWAKQADTTGRLLASFVNPMNSASTVEPGLVGGALEGVPIISSWSSTAGAGAGVGGVAVTGRKADFAILESNVVNFSYDQGAEAPSAIRIGLWAYLITGVRRGSRKATGA